tara:strand:- start:1802 stop:2761 length:960 start_codon:yes stop_codon:yes gene_type:complete
MACGLGAIALILVLVKEDVLPSSFVDAQEIKQTLEELDKAKNESLSIKKTLQNNESKMKEISKRIDETQYLLGINKEIIEEKKINLKEQETETETSSNEKNKYEEFQKGYLSGCNVEGNKVVFLLDSSASMLHKKLGEIFRLSVSDNSIKKNSQKWKQALSISDWFLEKLPISSQFKFITFNEEPYELSTNSNWIYKSESAAVKDIKNSLIKIVPEKGTNLMKPFELISDDGADSIYVVTDGLPTQGKGRRCENDNLISGECRRLIFFDSINLLKKANKRIKINFILLPIEGDIMAPYFLSDVAKSSNGCFIAPPRDWP